MNDLILSNKSLISNVEIAQILSRASIHFEVIALAREKKIVNDAERFIDCVYPRELLDVIEKEITRLTTRLKELEKE